MYQKILDNPDDYTIMVTINSHNKLKQYISSVEYVFLGNNKEELLELLQPIRGIFFNPNEPAILEFDDLRTIKESIKNIRMELMIIAKHTLIKSEKLLTTISYKFEYEAFQGYEVVHANVIEELKNIELKRKIVRCDYHSKNNYNPYYMVPDDFIKEFSDEERRMLSHHI
jgi:hypothetical protein